MEMVTEPAELLNVRPKPHGVAEELEVLLQWKGLSKLEATWEDSQLVRHQFQNFHLEDKVKVWAASNVRPQKRFMYARRKGTVNAGTDVGS